MLFFVKSFKAHFKKCYRPGERPPSSSHAPSRSSRSSSRTPPKSRGRAKSAPVRSHFPPVLDKKSRALLQNLLLASTGMLASSPRDSQSGAGSAASSPQSPRDSVVDSQVDDSQVEDSLRGETGSEIEEIASRGGSPREAPKEIPFEGPELPQQADRPSSPASPTMSRSPTRSSTSSPKPDKLRTRDVRNHLKQHFLKHIKARSKDVQSPRSPASSRSSPAKSRVGSPSRYFGRRSPSPSSPSRYFGRRSPSPSRSSPLSSPEFFRSRRHGSSRSSPLRCSLKQERPRSPSRWQEKRRARGESTKPIDYDEFSSALAKRPRTNESDKKKDKPKEHGNAQSNDKALVGSRTILSDKKFCIRIGMMEKFPYLPTISLSCSFLKKIAV